MKQKLTIVLLLAATLTACQNKTEGTQSSDNSLQAQVDSLTRANEQKDTEINEMLSLLNDVEEGFRQINEAQGRVVVERTGEGASASARIHSDMQFIQQTLAQNNELIQRLRQRLNSTSIRSEQLTRTIETLTTQMQEKTTELETLRGELAARNIHIAELDEQISQRDHSISNLQDDNQQKDQTITQQDQQLNTAWYVFGTKNELKEHQILHDGRVLQQSFDTSYFTQIDIRQTTVIPLYSRDAKLLTSHPEGSYTLDRDANRQYTLHINNPQQFWSTSKYLVIQVK